MPAAKLSADVRRHEPITALFTKDEKDSIIQAALARGIPPGILVRRAALSAAAQKEASNREAS